MTAKPSDLGLSLQKLLKEMLGIIKDTPETGDRSAAPKEPTPERARGICEQ
jgi:hypothetical protein